MDINSLLTSLSSLIGNPTPAKTLVDTLNGDRSDITEKNFTSEELDFIKNLIKQQQQNPDLYTTSGNITYDDYHNYARKAARTKGTPLVVSQYPGLTSLFDPFGRIMTTLGQFKWNTDPTSQDYLITDNYDFNWGSASTNREYLTAGWPYSAIRAHAGDKIPPGTGRSVKIRIPK